MMIPLVSFFPHLPQHVKFVKLYNIENILGITHYFLWQNYSELNSSFYLPISWCLLYTPKKHLGRPSNQDNSGAATVKRKPKQGRSQRESGTGGLSPLSQTPIPLSHQMKWHFLQGFMESHQFESRSAPPPLRRPPYFEKPGYAPANETAQNIIEFEHGHKRQVLSRSTIFMLYLLYITCKALIWKNALICNWRFHLGIDSK